MVEESFGRKGTFFQFFASLIANMMAVTDGMSMGWTAPMIPYFMSEKTHIKMTRNQADWLENSLLIGAFVGLPTTMYFVDKIGRRKSLMLATSVLIICWIAVAIADRVEYIYVARFFKGLGLNMAFVAAPMYVGEISHKNIRGILSSSIFVLMLIGVLIIYSVGPFVPFFVPSIIAGGLLLIELVVFFFLPESPYYLLVRNKDDDARKSLLRFRDNPADVEVELREMAASLEEDRKTEKSSLKDIFLVKSYRKPMTIMIALNVAQLFSGFEVILMNLHEILDSAGSIYVSPSSAAIIFATFMLVASSLASLSVDKFGRKLLLIVSSILTGVCLLTLGLYFNLKHSGYDMTTVSWIPIVAVMTYATSFKLGLGVVPIVLTAEIFASKIKAIGMSLGDAVYVGASLLALQLYFSLKEHLGIHIPFYIFCCCSLSTSLFVWFFVPETKGKSLDEIQEIMRGEVAKSPEENVKLMEVKGQ
ncbi:facilitated trehalose transporter Tret1 [Leptinotarsa decemlineata]|uniref:facilitated trehalose transporter Tret1 n=1 Tax=Leptinotarsa decemlineata TaxID=7539 RepID=UPI003D309362